MVVCGMRAVFFLGRGVFGVGDGRERQQHGRGVESVGFSSIHRFHSFHPSAPLFCLSTRTLHPLMHLFKGRWASGRSRTPPRLAPVPEVNTGLAPPPHQICLFASEDLIE